MNDNWEEMEPCLPFYYICMFYVWSLITDRVKIQFQFSIVFPQNRADCVVRELWSGLVGWRHSVQPSEPLFSCLFIYKVDGHEQIWNLHKESWANTFLEAPGSGFVLWTGFFVGLPSPTALVLRAFVFLLPHILFMLNLFSISQV